jgi:Holliday junction resolvasome RuvABC DNA-binding subunit
MGEKTEFFLYHHKTENSEYLFAFLNRDEKALFRQLLKVSGVG